MRALYAAIAGQPSMRSWSAIAHATSAAPSTFAYVSLMAGPLQLSMPPGLAESRPLRQKEAGDDEFEWMTLGG